MAVELKAYDIAERLTDEVEIAHYLEAVFEDGDPALIKAAMSDVARARGMTDIAKQANISRAGLYNALGPNGNPTFETIQAVLGALGLRLSVEPLEKVA